MILKLSVRLLITSRLLLIHVSTSQENQSRYNDRPNCESKLGNSSRIRQTPLVITSSIHSTSPPIFSVRTNLTRFIPQKSDLIKCRKHSKSLLCDEADNYPWKEVRRILSSRKLPLEFFADDSLTITNPKTITSDQGGSENQFCESVSTLQFPKVALNKNLELRYIIQGDSRLSLNGVWTEACSAGATCALAAYFPFGIKSNCVQKFMIRKLFAVDPKTGNPYVDSFPIPSCCMCMFSSDDSEYDNL